MTLFQAHRPSLRQRWHACALAALAALFLPSTAPAASHYAEVVLWARTDSPFNVDPAFFEFSDSAGRSSTPVQVVGSGSAGDGHARARTGAFAHAASGGGVHLGAAALVGTVPGRAAASADASAMGDFEDAFVITAPGVPLGTVVSATLALRVDGWLDAHSTLPFAPNGMTWTNAAADWSAAFIVAQGSARPVDWFAFGRETVHNGSVTTAGTAPGQFLFTVPLTVGQPVALRIQGQLSIDVNVSSRGNPLEFQESLQSAGEARFENTMAWDGLLALRDAQGAPILGYSAISPSSGIDYVLPYVAEVPEPASGLLFAAGLLALQRLRARRQAQPLAAALP